MQNDNKRQTPLGTLRSSGIPYALPGAWSRCRPHEDLFHLEKIEGVEVTLAAEHPVDELMKAGLGNIDAQGKFQLSPHVVENKSLLLALRQGREQPPFQVVAGMRGLGGKHLPWATLLGDYFVQTQLLEHNGHLLVAFTMDDVAVLRSMNLPAIPVMDLASLSGAGLEKFRKKLEQDLRNPTGAEPQEDDSGRLQDAKPLHLSLVFVDWSPAKLDGAAQPGAEPLRRHLLGICEYLEFDPTSFSVWNPKAKDLQGIDFCLRHGQPRQVQEALLESLGTSRYWLDEPRGGYRSPPITLATTMANLLKPASQLPGHWSSDEPWKQFHERLETEVFAPLLERACNASDPLEKNELLQIAILSRLVLPQALQMSIDAVRASRDRPQSGAQQFPADEFKQVLSLSDRVLSATERALERQAKKEKKEGDSQPAKTKASTDPRHQY